MENQTPADQKPPPPYHGQKWEYQILQIAPDGLEDVHEGLNAAGQHGWEAITALGGEDGKYVIFLVKRPVSNLVHGINPQVQIQR